MHSTSSTRFSEADADAVGVSSRGVSSQKRARVISALARLDSWIESEAFKGWDPYDALNSPFLKWAGSKQRLLGILIVQLLRRSPLNFRTLLKIPKDYNAKGMGLFLATYAQKFNAFRGIDDLKKIRMLSEWLVKSASSGYSGLCWGYNFDWPNRNFLALAKTPTIVNTAFIGLAFLAAEPALAAVHSNFHSGARRNTEVHQEHNADGVVIARSACEFILKDLRALRPGKDEICFFYTPIDHRAVHNANVLGAWLLAAVYARTGEKHLATYASRAARFTVRRQLPDGSWTYGTAPNDRWVDNFHTGYVLVALKRVAELLRTDEFDSAIKRGFDFWNIQMFQGTVPKFYPERLYPIDVHSVAQAILTWLEFSDLQPGVEQRAWELADWATVHMQDSEGFFYYQIRRFHKIRIPYMRWSQAWMQQALTFLTAFSTHRPAD